MDVSLDIGAEIEVFSASSHISYSWTSSALTRRVKENSSSVTKQDELSVTIGPIMVPDGKCLTVYERVAVFPHLSRRISTTKYEISLHTLPVNTPEKVTMKIPVNSIRFLSNLTLNGYKGRVKDSYFLPVKIGANGTPARVPERDGDINKGFGGQFTYIRRHFTDNPHDAFDNVAVSITSSYPSWARQRGESDMAAGAGGKYRCLDVWHRRNFRDKVVEAVLWEGPLYEVPNGWTGMTGDINAGRHGRYLYVVWKSLHHAIKMNPDYIAPNTSSYEPSQTHTIAEPTTSFVAKL